MMKAVKAYNGWAERKGNGTSNRTFVIVALVRYKYIKYGIACLSTGKLVVGPELRELIN